MPKTNLIIDGHVHFYGCYDSNKFFDSAIKNMDDVHTSLYPADNNYQRILLFTEGKDNDYFSQFKRNDIPVQKSEYRFENTQEENAIILLKNGQPVCYILAGRQIVTGENIEVLSIASDQNIEDGLPIVDVIERLINNKEIAVLAWGVGKWFFKRGKIIKEMIEKYHSPYLFIGDNSARPSFWPKPEQYHLAEKHNIRILRGSDPLPFSKEACRVGSFGFAIEGDFQQNKPADSFRKILISNKKNIALFGHQDSAIPFIKRQVKNFFL